jgi:hypothetical protein
MMMVTGAKSEDILLLLELLGEETIVAPSEQFPFRVSRRGRGYSDDPQRGRLQASREGHLSNFSASEKALKK